MGLTMSQWDALDEHDRAWSLAAELVEAEKAAETEAATCPACGGPAAECQDPDNQHAYVWRPIRCYRTRARVEAEQARAKKTTDDAGILWVGHLDPTRKKSAQKGARSG